jgi:putative hydrolase of the HAD superfamily
MTPPRAILFDLGGVVLDIDFSRALAAWAPHSRLSSEQLRAAFAADEPFQRHETGHLDNDAYFTHLRRRLALDCELAQVQAGFNSIFVGEIAETVQMLDALRDTVPCYAISNTNAAHVAEIERAFPRLLPRFARVFASYRIGHRKPHPAAFTHVLQEIALPAPEVLLFDDLQPNIDAARALGLQAVRVTSPADVRAALAERGLLSASGPAAPPRN